MEDAHVTLTYPYSYDNIINDIKTAQQLNIHSITYIEDSVNFIECEPIYRNVCASYSYQTKWYHQINKRSLKEYQAFIDDMRTKSFNIPIKFGLCISYFASMEGFISQIKQQYNYDVVIARVDFIDDIAYSWKESDVMFWNKYHSHYIFHRYYELVYALISSSIFDGLADFDLITKFQQPTFTLKHTYRKIASSLRKYHMYVEASCINPLSQRFLNECKDYRVAVKAVDIMKKDH